jgi:hypothetical protein
MQELKKEAEIIRDKSNPVRFYNYSYVKEILEKKHKVHVSLPTIIDRAKKMGITNKGPLAKAHDREVLTNLWSPLAQTKWYLITTIDDHSRRILHGDLWDKETSWDPYRGSESRPDPVWLSVEVLCR